MLKAAYFNRRRLALGLGVGAIYLALWEVPQTVFGSETPFGVVLGAIVMAAMLLLPVFAILQRIREILLVLIEVTLLAFLPFALLRMVAPQYDVLVDGGVGAAFMLAISFALSFWAIAGNLLDAHTMTEGPINNFTFPVRAPLDVVWRSLVPLPGHEETYAFEGTKFIVDTETDEDENQNPCEMTVSLHGQDWALHTLFRVKIGEMIEGRYFRAEFVPLDAKGVLETSIGWFALTFAPQANGVVSVQVELQVLTCPLRWRTMWYLGDCHVAFSEYVQHMISRQISQIDDKQERHAHPALASA